MSQAGADALAQDLVLKLVEDRQQPGHRPSGWCRQIQGLGQGDETHSEITEFLERGHQVGHRASRHERHSGSYRRVRFFDAG